MTNYLYMTYYMLHWMCLITIKGILFLLKLVWILLKPLGRMIKNWLSDQMVQMRNE